MADTVDTTETTQEPLSTEVPQTTPTQDNGTQTADAAALKAQLDKLEMERNMLRKQKDALEKEKSDRERKELEEKEDYRSLAERAIAEAEALRKEKTDAESAQAQKLATETVYAGFDPKVVEIAKTAGITAADDSEEAQAALKAKLEAIQEKVGVTKQPAVTPNNPGTHVPVDEQVQYINPVAVKDNIDMRGAAIWRNGRSAQTQLKNSTAIAMMKKESGMAPQEI